MLQKIIVAILTGTMFFFSLHVHALANEQRIDAKWKLPESILSIEKENTVGPKVETKPVLEPSTLTRQLLQSSNVSITNEDLIKYLNETTIKTTPFSVGNKAIIYLGVWPLSYESVETTPNWEYQIVNTNYYDNRYNNNIHVLHYVQESEKVVKGGLTSKVSNPETVKTLLLNEAKKKTNLPLAYETTIGVGTKKDHKYHVQKKHLGYLYAHSPAIQERGNVTYGEVYLMIKGTTKKLLVKNISTQEVSAWIPIENHLSFSYYSSEKPK